MPENNTAENFFSQKPPELSKMESVKQFLWNPRTHQCMGRTAKSWCLITVFYLIFYTLLALFFLAMLAVFYQTLDPNEPKWQLDYSIIGSNPGMGYYPKPPSKHIQSTLITFTHQQNNKTWGHWYTELDNYLKPYERLAPASGEHIQQCSFGNNFKKEEDQVCHFNIQTELGKECIKEQNFGYDVGKPCIFIRLNKIFGWKPEVYNSSSEVPNWAPDQLKDIVKEQEREHGGKLPPAVWVTCEGENPADKENIGEIEYYPYPGFAAYYFPYRKNPSYLSPIVAIRFKSPTYGILINIECKAWAKNIHPDRYLRLGTVHFELMID